MSARVSRSRSVLAAIVLATCGLAAGGSALAAAAPTSSPPPAPAPGPRLPVEHIGLSGGLFEDASGEPGCYVGEGGTEIAGYLVPRGALVTGLTAYVVDPSSTAGVGVTLDRHSLVSGGTYRLGSTFTAGAAGTTTLAIQLKPGVLVDEPSSINVNVSVGKGTCFKGAEVHFIRDGAAALAQSPGGARTQEPTAAAAEPDGTLR